MFRNLTIGKKLMVSFGSIIFLLIILSAYTIFSIISANKEVNKLDERFDEILYVAEIQREINAIDLNIRKMLTLTDISKKQEIMKEIEEHRKYYRKKIEELEKITKDQEERQKLQNVINKSNEIRDANNKVMQLAITGKNQEAIELYFKEVELKSENIQKALNELMSYYHSTANKTIDEINRTFKYDLLISIALSVISITIAVFFAIFISSSVKTPVTEIKGVLDKVAQGDLSVDIKLKSKDELGMIAQSIREAITNIKNLIAETKTVSTSLASSSEELSATTEEISRNLKSQTERASQIASAAEEMSQTVVDIAKNASQIAEVRVTTANVA
ncbi:MAG: methyl-accepting chemotaxis protein, partial [Thermodesulfovibrio sp.]|nr:methyl-accepting chemotaxis protein [Thermodesulfovibrio sp.]